MSSFIWVIIFQVELWLLIRVEVNHLKATHGNQLKVNKGQITTTIFSTLVGLSTLALIAEPNSVTEPLIIHSQ